MRMSFGTSRAVSFETITISPIARGTAQRAGCSQRIRSSGCAAQKSTSPCTGFGVPCAVAAAESTSVMLVVVIVLTASRPPASMPVAAPFIVMWRHHALRKSSGK